MKVKVIERIMLVAQSIHLIKKLLQWKKLVLPAQLNKPYLETSLPPSTLRHQTHHTPIPHQLTLMHLSQPTQSTITYRLSQPDTTHTVTKQPFQPIATHIVTKQSPQPVTAHTVSKQPPCTPNPHFCMATLLVHNPMATC